MAVGADGKYISDCYNFTEFCIDLTRGSAEGKKRCEQCDREGHGVYPCHAGLVDFGIPITLEDGTVLGSIIGGQVLPENLRSVGKDEVWLTRKLREQGYSAFGEVFLALCDGSGEAPQLYPIETKKTPREDGK